MTDKEIDRALSYFCPVQSEEFPSVIYKVENISDKSLQNFENWFNSVLNRDDFVSQYTNVNKVHEDVLNNKELYNSIIEHINSELDSTSLNSLVMNLELFICKLDYYFSTYYPLDIDRLQYLVTFWFKIKDLFFKVNFKKVDTPVVLPKTKKFFKSTRAKHSTVS